MSLLTKEHDITVRYERVPIWHLSSQIDWIGDVILVTDLKYKTDLNILSVLFVSRIPE